MSEPSRAIVHADQLQAITPIVPTQGVPSGSRGVLITAYPSGGVVMVAYNGNVLAMLHYPAGTVTGPERAWKPTWPKTRLAGAQGTDTLWIALEASPAGQGTCRYVSASSPADVLASYGWAADAPVIGAGDDMICHGNFAPWQSILCDEVGKASTLPLWITTAQIDLVRSVATKVGRAVRPAPPSPVLSLQSLGSHGMLVRVRGLDEIVFVLAAARGAWSNEATPPDWLLEVRDTYRPFAA
jgi:hypothetical protein